MTKLFSNKLGNYSEWGFEVVLVEDFMEVLSLFVQSEPHLVLMDIGLPLFNGYHWCQEIRKISKVPIMFLSSRDQAMDIVMAINMGRMTLWPSLLTSRCSLQVQGLLRRSYELAVMKVCWSMQVWFSIPSLWTCSIRGSSEFDQEWISNFGVLFEHAGNIEPVMTWCGNSGTATFHRRQHLVCQRCSFA